MNEQEKEVKLSPEGERALKNWKRKTWTLRIAVAVVALTVLIFGLGPISVYGIGKFQLSQGKYEKAIATFEWIDTKAGPLNVHTLYGSLIGKGGGYRDCETKVLECHYRWGLSLMEEGKYSEAVKQFNLAEDYENSKELIAECVALHTGG